MTYEDFYGEKTPTIHIHPKSLKLTIQEFKKALVHELIHHLVFSNEKERNPTKLKRILSKINKMIDYSF